MKTAILSALRLGNSIRRYFSVVKLPSSLLMLRISLWCASRFSGDSPFAVVVAMPFGAHMADLALERVPVGYSKLCIVNGQHKKERAFLRRSHSQTLFIYVPWTLDHHDVIDALISCLDSPFWLVDHDCLILDSNCLGRAEDLSAGRIGAVYFAERNPVNGFLKPHTFLMLLRPKIAREVFRRYRISSSPVTWQELDSEAQKICSSLGFSPSLLPETYKGYFDTLCLAAVIAEAEQIGFYAIRSYSGKFAPHPEAIHVGATSNPRFTPEWEYVAFGAYFWSLVLQREAAACLRTSYLKKYPTLADPKTMRQVLIDTGISDDVLTFLDRLVAG